MAVKVLPPVAGGDPARSWYKIGYPPSAGGRGREVRLALVACIQNPKFAETLIIPGGKARSFGAISSAIFSRFWRYFCSFGAFLR